MSSDLRRRPWPVLALVAGTFVLHACGHKKAPVPPPRMIPQTVSQLRVHQRGDEAVLRFPYPTTNYRGVALSGISRVELFQLVKPIPPETLELYEQQVEEWKAERAAYQEALATRQPLPVEGAAAPAGEPAPTEPEGEPAEPPAAEEEAREEPSGTPTGEGEAGEPEAQAEGEPATGEGEDGEEGEEAEEEALRAPGPAPSPVDMILVDARHYERDAEIVATLEGAELESAILGGDVVLRIPLAPAPGAGTTGYAFAVRTRSQEGLESALSPISPQAKLLYQEPPAAPASLTIEPQPDGVRVAWSVDAPPEEGFKVYRREAQTREYTDALATLGPDVVEYIDRGAVLGARYIYAATAVEREQPLLESALSVEREVFYQDRFPPAPPRELVAFPEEGQVRVLWDASTSDDVAGYIVYRREEGGSARALTEEPVDDLEYVDTKVEPGQVLLYAAVAVDGAGNRSDASAEVRVRIP